MEQAKVGDKIDCKCKNGPHCIIEGSPSSFLDGMPIARVGDKCSCGAVIVSGLSWIMVDGKPAAINASVTSCGGKVIARSSSRTGHPKSNDTSQPHNFGSIYTRYNEKIRLLDSNSLPIANQSYIIIRQDGSHERGITDEYGVTHLLKERNNPENIEIFMSLTEENT